jgi:hypothetical protein
MLFRNIIWTLWRNWPGCQAWRGVVFRPNTRRNREGAVVRNGNRFEVENFSALEFQGVDAVTRQQLLLAILAAAKGRPYSPVQIQKAVFLITRNLPNLVTEGDRFEFVPYDYGPFDSDVYLEAEELQRTGAATIASSGSGRWNVYSATDEGAKRGSEVLSRLAPQSRQYVENVSNWIRSQSFGSLVRSIYEAYPEMRQNSIFQD